MSVFIAQGEYEPLRKVPVIGKKEKSQLLYKEWVPSEHEPISVLMDHFTWAESEEHFALTAISLPAKT